MRKAIRDNRGTAVPLTVEVLDQLLSEGWRFVQVKGLTTDNHYEHIDPHHLVLIPIKRLPRDQGDKDIYEPIESELRKSWARDTDARLAVFVVAESNDWLELGEAT